MPFGYINTNQEQSQWLLGEDKKIPSNLIQHFEERKLSLDLEMSIATQNWVRVVTQRLSCFPE